MIKYASARAKACVTGKRETFLPEARRNPRLCFIVSDIIMNIKEISVFVDESGSYDPNRGSSRYYLVCMVFHDQHISIENEITALETSFENMGLPGNHCVHAGPLIRREEEYATMSREKRRGIFRRMFLFMHKANISYHCFKIDKNFIGNSQGIHDPLLRQIVRFLLDNEATLTAFDKIKVYYDNGQRQVTALLKEAFALLSATTEFVSNVEPSRYRLFQAADIACTLELARLHLEDTGKLSESEYAFFGGPKNFRKNYLKLLDRKHFT